ncbi:hypothetical protein KDAU_55700 [Dictyobacter aurantiacus]|uniref:Uncharacterized protein n=1 Tax=Dictyobacter aurantiacus TaxID=1936993 RepID=A0A401ZMZ5_9CHLR|nr:hypothetical protein KDAU_55700 [Dictyobacter aurantiacus]
MWYGGVEVRRGASVEAGGKLNRPGTWAAVAVAGSPGDLKGRPYRGISFFKGRFGFQWAFCASMGVS